MSVLISVLQEELGHAKRLEKKYQKSLSELPQGSFIVRKVGSKQYGYLTRRDKSRVIQEYLGLMEDSTIAKFREQVSKKKKYKDLLKQVKAQIKILERALRGTE